MTLLASIIGAHNLVIVLLAFVLCGLGMLVSMRLLDRARLASGPTMFSWVFMVGIVAGTAVWSTHFIDMLAYRSGVEAGYDPVHTALSLMGSIAGAFAAFAIAVQKRWPLCWEAGGLVFGLSAAVMHFAGMGAYEMHGHAVAYQSAGVAATLIVAMLFGLLGFAAFHRLSGRWKLGGASAFLVAGIGALHFTGVAAMHDPALSASGTVEAQDGLTLALTVAGMACLVFGTGLVTSFLDARTRTEADRSLRYQADHDSLTGLPNREGFTRRVGARLAASKTSALVLINIDRFRDINDVHGHRAGDKALKIVAHRLRSALYPEELLARIGSDEFVVHAAAADLAELALLVQRLQGAFDMLADLDGTAVEMHASYGVAFHPEDGEDIETLLNNAGLAMARAKTLPGQAIAFYEASIDEMTRQRRSMVSDMRDAMALGQFELHYQVQRYVATREISGYEALLRWRHPQRGLVPPLDFISLAEETGVIVELGAYVLRTACREAAEWKRPYRVAVNVSPVQLLDPGFAKLVETVLVETGLTPSRLEIEVTESTLIADPDATVKVLKAVRALGVSVAMDDFGTGYSSLASLSVFPFDRIKLDKAFIAELEHSPQSRAIVQAVLTIGKSLHIPVLAEGVEREDQLSFLLAEGCTEGQGFLLGRPSRQIELPDTLTRLHVVDRRTA